MGSNHLGLWEWPLNSKRGEQRILSIHRYPASTLLSDGFRAVFGVTATLLPLAFLDIAWPVMLVLGGLGAIFLVFAFKVAEHGLSSIELSDHGISRRGAMAPSLAWRDLRALKLAHFAAPRRPSDGWYQLTLKGDDGALKVESTIDGFDEIVAAAAKAAEAIGLGLDPATSENLKGLGHELGRSDVVDRMRDF